MTTCPVCESKIKDIFKWIATSFDGTDVTKYRCSKCNHRWQSTPRKSKPPELIDVEDDIEMYIDPYRH